MKYIYVQTDIGAIRCEVPIMVPSMFSFSKLVVGFSVIRDAKSALIHAYVPIIIEYIYA